MATLTITYEKNEVKKVLEFRGDTYTLIKKVDKDKITVVPEDQTFSYQFAERYPEDDRFMGICDNLDMVGFGDEDEVLEALEYLDSIEMR